jgi:hypothetical protein
MTTFYPPELVRSTGTLTVEKAVITPAAGTASIFDLDTDKSALGSLGVMNFIGHDSGANNTTYACIEANIEDNTDTSEDASLDIKTMQAGTLTSVGVFELGLTMNGATGGDQGSGTINATGMFINGVAVSTTTGDVVGPAGATDNAIARYDTATGKLIQNSLVLIDDTGNVTGVNDLTVGGDLTVQGTLTTIDTVNLTVEDSLIHTARNNNTTDALDIGLVGLYDTSGAQDLYAGIFRDASDNKWKLFVDSQEDLSATNVVNTGAAGYTVGTLVANLEGNVTGQVSDISNFDTDDLAEGATNKYASTANVDAAGAVMETDFNAQTVLVAVADDTPIAQVVGDSEFVGRPAGGNVGVMTATQARTVLNVEDGAEANLDWNTAVLVEGVDYTALDTSLTLPVAAPGDDEDHVRVNYEGIDQHPDQWSISGTTLTVAAIPVGIDRIKLQVLA